jgi:dethiobiotin synthetase
MKPRIVVTGTDTGIGKTVFSAALVAALDGIYWKPVQSGLEEETDTETVLRLSGLDARQVLPEAYRLKTPASPHLAAAIDNVVIETDRLVLPQVDRPLVVEGAGGLLVPLTRDVAYIDVMARWGAPVVLCARTSLGTINHSLLSLEALRARRIPVLGIAFIGDENAESERIIVEMSRIRRLGRLPHLTQLKPETLKAAFARHFNVANFIGDAA